MKKRLLCVGALLITVLVNSQQQQDSTKVEELQEIIISDSRFPLKREHSGKTIIKIDALELERNQGRTIAELINSKSGIEINGSRSNGGQNLSYFIRGGNNRQVLVLIDGIQVSDPSQIAGDYDFRLLNINQIESIEIIKGAASTLYGNSAATAVINISTKKASTELISATFSSNIGTNQSTDGNNNTIADFTNNVSVSGSKENLNYKVSFAHKYQDGMSAADTGIERDAFSRTNINFQLGHKITDKFSLNINADQDRFTADFDNSFPVEDALFSTISKQYRIGLSPKFTYDNGNLTINAAYNSIDREIKSNFPITYASKSLIIDAFNRYKINNNFYTIVGLNYVDNKTKFTIDEQANSLDPYANVVWITDFGLNLNIGTRLNNHSEYGTNLIYNLNPSYTYKFNDNYIKLLASYSTSFIAPSLSQMFGPFGANPDLDPETNTTLEAGIELNLAKKLRLSTVFFSRTEKDFIDYVIIDFDTFEGQYQNVPNNFIVNGVEVEIFTKLVENLDFKANYTFTERKEVVALRIPKHKINASLNYTINDKTFVGLNYQFTDERTDTNFSTFINENLNSFSLVDLLLNHDLIPNRLKLSASVTNIFNESYTEIIGFTTKGRNYRFGLRLKF